MTGTSPPSLVAFVSLLLLFFGVAAAGESDGGSARPCPSCAFAQPAAPQFERELTGAACTPTASR